MPVKRRTVLPSRQASVRYRALTDMSLRQSADPEDPKYQEWHEWPKGKVFTAPPNLNVARALERGIMELVAGKTEVSDGSN